MPDMIRAANQERALSALLDVADMRDRFYEPTLATLRQEVIPEVCDLNVRDQGDLPTCVGFALAAVIDRLRAARAPQQAVSPVMLYRMAQLHDDFAEKGKVGSTLRGALKGFFHNGVCKEADAPYNAQTKKRLEDWELDATCVASARDVTLGAYYRLNHIINDYHAAINETGAIIVSARIHDGWAVPNDLGEIEIRGRKREYHAFAIVGYTDSGFLIQNSWGKDWGGYGGLPGVALWRYEDWFANVHDAWALKLGISSRSAFDFKVASNFGTFVDPTLAEQLNAPRRQDIFGHYLNLDDGALVKTGRFAQNVVSVSETVKLLQSQSTDSKAATPIKHLLIYAHGAMTTQQDSAKRIRAWKDVFRANGIYPVHIMWQTGFNTGMVDLLADVLLKTRDRMGKHTRLRDERLEKIARPLGRKLWRDLKCSAVETLKFQSEGGDAICKLLAVADHYPRLKVHFVGVSAGAYLMAELVKLLRHLRISLSTATLLAPACSLEHYEREIAGQIGKTIGSVLQFNLSAHRESNDQVGIYQKSLLHLVSNALESVSPPELLGLQRDLETKFTNPWRLHPKHRVCVAGNAKGSVTNASTHQGFESDVATMNSMLAHILGVAPSRTTRFKEPDLVGYERRSFDQVCPSLRGPRFSKAQKRASAG